MAVATITPQEVEVGDEIHEIPQPNYATGAYYTVTFIDTHAVKAGTAYEFYTTAARHIWVLADEPVAVLR